MKFSNDLFLIKINKITKKTQMFEKIIGNYENKKKTIEKSNGLFPNFL